MEGRREQEMGELLPNGHRISVWDDEKVMEIDNGDDYTIL